MNYTEALSYIHSTQRFGSKPGLARVQALLNEMGNPQKSLRFVHVAGTNGKGSTVAMTASILQAAGYKTGMYISPFVEDFCERIRIDGEMIPREKLAELCTEGKKVIDAGLLRGMPQPTEFEIITALAFLYFAREECDIVVSEVGLGGRFDATNAIDAPLVAAITSISLDHTRILGDSISQITFEKCGILKEGCFCAVTCAGQNPEAITVIRDTCREKGISLSIPDEDQFTFLESGLHGSRMTYKGKPYHVPLIGAHQLQNALTALEIADALKQCGFALSDEAVYQGMSRAKWNGRLEVVRQTPLCLIDGAHNVDSCAVLSAALDSLFSDKKRMIIVMGMSGDKDADSCVPMLAKRADVFIATRHEIPGALPAEKTAALAAPFCGQVETHPDPVTASQRALSLADSQDIVIGCGSLYLIGAIKKGLREF